MKFTSTVFALSQSDTAQTRGRARNNQGTDLDLSANDLIDMKMLRTFAHVGFDEALSHLIEAGADIFLMPSRFEPCGLSQMYSQRYGTPPVVHATGGLIDTVLDCNAASLEQGVASGFVFRSMNTSSLLATARRAAMAYHDKKTWRTLQHNCMVKDFSWSQSATAYHDIYTHLMRR